MKAKEKKTGDASSPNLLLAWIQTKFSEHPEPQRKGTLRGDPIGIGTKKYFAILLSLSNSKLKHLAQQVGVSYPVLLKWRTEGEFKKQVNTHRREFAEYWLCDYAIRSKSTPVKISDVPKFHMEWNPAAACVPDFSEELVGVILKLAFSRLENKRKADEQWWKKLGYSDLDEMGRLIFIAEVCDEFGRFPLLEMFRPVLEKMLINDLRSHIQPGQGRPKIDKEDALVLLDMLEKMLGVHDIK